jgi:hypothetical protein
MIKNKVIIQILVNYSSLNIFFHCEVNLNIKGEINEQFI